jgi:hypothetical protein
MIGIGVIAAASSLLPADGDAPPDQPGWTPWVERARQTGDFADVERELRQRIDKPQPEAGASDCEIALEILRRIRLDFSDSPEQMLERVRRDIPDVTLDDLERWRADGVLQYQMIDGQVRYFKREPSNLYRFCEEARARRDRHQPPKPPSEATKPQFVLTDHLAALVQMAEHTDGPELYPVKHHVRYTIRVNDGHPRVKKGALVRCWLPFPQEYRQQKDVRLLDAGPGEALIARNGYPQRTVYLEKRIEDPAQPVEFFAEFEFTTSAYYPALDPAKVTPYDPDDAHFRENSGERPPHIVFTPALRKQVEAIVGDETNPLLKARRIFHWVSQNVRYCSEMEYSTISNLSGKAFETRKGDCGVQGILFITMCRCAGVPARWQSGWETKPSGWNMHDWAEVYVQPWGWLPVDPSYGLQDHPDPKVHEFYFGHLDPYRMIVNLDYGAPLLPAKHSFRSEPIDFQRSEIEIDGQNLYFNEWDWTFDLRTVPPELGGSPVRAVRTGD